MPQLHSLPRESLERFVQRSKASSLPEEPDMSVLLGQILSKAAELVPSESGAILLDDPLSKQGDPQQNTLHFVSAFGPAAGQLMGVSMSASEGVAGHVYSTGTAHLSAETGEDETFAPETDEATGYSTRSIIAAPILMGGAVCGTIELLNRLDGGSYDPNDLLLLQVFASYTASSLQNALDARHAQELAKVDDLTGLFNDRYLHARLREEVAGLQSGEDRCALIFLDLDHFKPVNDRYGHLVGSQVLREVGFVLRRATVDQDAVLARYGGDEFAVLLPGRSAREAVKVGEAVRSAIAEAVFLDRERGEELPALRLQGLVTASVGVAETRGPGGAAGEEARALIRRADEAMYRAKSDGRNGVAISGQEDQEIPHLAFLPKAT